MSSPQRISFSPPSPPATPLCMIGDVNILKMSLCFLFPTFKIKTKGHTEFRDVYHINIA